MISFWPFAAAFSGIFVIGVTIKCLNRLYETRSLQSVRDEFRKILVEAFVIVLAMMISSAFYLWMGWPLGENRK